MGLLPKNRIEELKRAKRAAKAAKKRKENVRIKNVHFLIVCEGEKTEPNYFKSLVKNNFSQVIEAYVEGTGMSTSALVKRAEELREEIERGRQTKFDKVWVVFDKDDFNDFNDAIELAKKKGYGCAWSNESFELWYCLHYNYLNSAISRKDYIKYLEGCIQKINGYENFKYKKNDPNIYSILKETGGEDKAKMYAERLRECYYDKDYASHNPCTTVDRLVEELTNPESVLDCIEKKKNQI